MASKRTDFSQGYTPQGMPIVLITEPTCEICDADGELNTVKFTTSTKTGGRICRLY